jgi:hypothetical protein
MESSMEILQKAIDRTVCQAPVAHACNPSYSGGRDQEDLGSKLAQANSSRDPILKKPYLEKTLHKKGLVEWLKV